MRKFMTIGAAAALAACGNPADGTYETEDGTAEVDIDDDGGNSEVRFTDNDGNETVVNTGTDVEAELPDGFTIYPGAEVLSNTTIDGAQGTGSMVSFSSSDAVDKVLAHYKREAEAAGIEIQMEMTAGDTKMIGGESGDGKFFSLNATSEGSGTGGVLMVGSQ